MDRSKTIQIVLLVLSLHSIAVKSSTVQENTICENQLNYFDNALSNREEWALFGENGRYILV